MRAFLTLLVLVALSFGFSGCASSCDPEEVVFAQVMASGDLNTYSEGGVLGSHQLDVYVFKVDEASTFLANDYRKLRVTDQAVSGGQALGRYEIGPGEKSKITIGAMANDRWTHIGIYAAYGDPSAAPDAQKRVVEIPGSCGIVLSLGKNGILSLEED